MYLYGSDAMSVYAEIAVGSFVSDNDNDMNIYDYIVPERYTKTAGTGMRVIVPFGSRHLEGYIIEIKNRTVVEPRKLREIRDIPDKEPLFDEMQIKLAKWMSEEYMCSLSDGLRCIIPSEMVLREYKYVRLDDENQNRTFRPGSMEMRIIDELSRAGTYVPVSKLKNMFGSGSINAVKKLADLGVLVSEHRIMTGVRDKTARGIQLCSNISNMDEILNSLGQKQSFKAQFELVEKLIDVGKPVLEKDFLEKFGFSKSTVSTLIKKGILESIKFDLARDPCSGLSFSKTSKPELTSEQKKVIEKILGEYKSSNRREFLIHGVTGSGKTEVYMSLIKHVVDEGKQAIMLVPEISLTPQTIERFKGRFERVAVLHSRLSAGEKYDEWKKIKNREVDVVVGARSAVFAPVEKLGIIIIDEEHEYSYKSDKNPKYHAREVAKKRCEMSGAMIVLGSATPSIETFYQSKINKYSICTMTKRVDDRLLPDILVSDMRQEITSGNMTIFSKKLFEEIKSALNSGHQAILFLNRRGFSTFVSCRKCGHVMKCPRCDVSLTYHADKNVLNCHYCDYNRKSPDTCPECGSKYIKYFGIGTQKVERDVKSYFPEARVLRMDLDTTSRKGSHERIYNAFKNNEADILVGTQMISKGLDFPNVTLVGIIAADLTLNIPDFKSGERTFQLITQVAGRAGRGEFPGRVIIQTYNPEHYSIVSALSNDYEGFYNKEILIRQSLGYPPYCDLINVVASAMDEEETVRVIRMIADEIKLIAQKSTSKIDILGPSPSPMSKINNHFRWQTIIKGNASRELKRQVIEITAPIIRKYKTVSINIDINPISLA